MTTKRPGRYAERGASLVVVVVVLVVVLIAGLAATDAYALIEPLQVWRGKHTGGSTQTVDQRLQHGDRGPLAVGPDHMHHRHVRQGARRPEGLHAVQGQVHVEQTESIHIFRKLGVFAEVCHRCPFSRKLTGMELP